MPLSQFTIRFNGILKSASFPILRSMADLLLSNRRPFQSEELYVLLSCHMMDVGQVCTLSDTTLSNKVCQWLTAGRWFSPGTPVSSTNKTDRHNITDMLLKVALNTITLTLLYVILDVNLRKWKTVIDLRYRCLWHRNWTWIWRLDVDLSLTYLHFNDKYKKIKQQ